MKIEAENGRRNGYSRFKMSSLFLSLNFIRACVQSTNTNSSSWVRWIVNLSNQFSKAFDFSLFFCCQHSTIDFHVVPSTNSRKIEHFTTTTSGNLKNHNTHIRLLAGMWRGMMVNVPLLSRFNHWRERENEWQWHEIFTNRRNSLIFKCRRRLCTTLSSRGRGSGKNFFFSCHWPYYSVQQCNVNFACSNSSLSSSPQCLDIEIIERVNDKTPITEIIKSCF